MGGGWSVRLPISVQHGLRQFIVRASPRSPCVFGMSRQEVCRRSARRRRVAPERVWHGPAQLGSGAAALQRLAAVRQFGFAAALRQSGGRRAPAAPRAVAATAPGNLMGA